MAMEDWVSTLMQQLCDDGNWKPYGGPNTVACEGEIDTDGGIAFLSLVFDEGTNELYFIWDPQHTISRESRPLYELAIEALNDRISKSEDLFGEFKITESGDVLYTISVAPMFEKLYPTAIDDINQFAMGVCGICGNMYPALLEMVIGKDMEQVMMLAFARGDQLGTA